ncbi:helix-turn-helix domain-containing protein [Halorubrum yunnanense]|uniref:Helix-turn-helix domain-containing protein n=1 Tax=Halorubrum yunnanense TaxID=1526162 RepID=A0ABD5YCS9_9EURY|nr:helix-turn-helix domain-containing protein [Halorubrum yunnanense]
MSRTRLRLDLPDGSWLGEVSRSSPETTLRVTGTVTADEGDVTALTAAGVGRAAAVDALRDRGDVDRVEVVERGRSETVARVAAPAPSYVAAARRAGVPVEGPVEVADGRATLVVVDDRERLSAFGRRLATAGATVESAGGNEPEPILTEAQGELVRAAIEAGYYDTPRECTLTELAADRDIAKSTCSETLHRAEGQVLRRFVEREEPFEADGSETESPPAVSPSSVDEPDDGVDGDAPHSPDRTGVTARRP